MVSLCSGPVIWLFLISYFEVCKIENFKLIECYYLSQLFKNQEVVTENSDFKYYDFSYVVECVFVVCGMPMCHLYVWLCVSLFSPFDFWIFKDYVSKLFLKNESKKLTFVNERGHFNRISMESLKHDFTSVHQLSW